MKLSNELIAQVDTYEARCLAGALPGELANDIDTTVTQATNFCEADQPASESALALAVSYQNKLIAYKQRLKRYT